MRFYKLAEVPVSPDDKVFKEAPLMPAIGVVIFFGIVIAIVVGGIEKWPKDMSPVEHYVLAGIICLIGLFPLGLFRASLKPSNWLLRCQLSGFMIKYRAYENWKLPADTLQAVGFDYGEIAWAKLVKEQRKQPSFNHPNQTETTWLTYISMGLANPNTAELEANLQAERNLRPDGRMVVLDYPVQVQPDGIVEIRWGAGIRPSAKKALEVLGQRVKILEPEHRNVDLTHRQGVNPDDEKAKILALAKSGDEIAAANLAQKIYGYSTTDANNFVDKLLGRKDE